MLRITTNEMNPGATALQLSGSISGAWVEELRDCCETLLATGSVVTLDLGDVQYADASGLELLSKLKSRKVSLVGWTPLVAQLLDSHEGRRTE